MYRASQGGGKEILLYDSKTDKWSKTGDLCKGRGGHAMSLVPASVEDHCIFDLDC